MMHRGRFSLQNLADALDSDIETVSSCLETLERSGLPVAGTPGELQEALDRMRAALCPAKYHAA